MNIKTILIASDDESTITCIGRILDKEHFQATYSNRASEILLKIFEVQFDVLILDIDLPGMSVLEILPIIKKVSPSVPLVVLSSDDSFKTGQEIAQFGRSLYLLKPVSIDKLQEFLDYISPVRVAAKS